MCKFIVIEEFIIKKFVKGILLAGLGVSGNSLFSESSSVNGDCELFIRDVSSTQTEAYSCIDCEEQRGSSNFNDVKTAVAIASSVRAKNSCEPKNKIAEGKLSPYWAQELIGSDLLREELNQLNSNSLPRGNYITVVDKNEDDRHGELVKNLISDKGPHSILPDLKNRIQFFDTSNENLIDEEHSDTRCLAVKNNEGIYLGRVKRRTTILGCIIKSIYNRLNKESANFSSFGVSNYFCV